MLQVALYVVTAILGAACVVLYANAGRSGLATVWALTTALNLFAALMAYRTNRQRR